MKKINLSFSRFIVLPILFVLLPIVAVANTMSTAIGTLPAPATGAGPGKILVLPLDGRVNPYTLTFGQAGTLSGNSFYPAESKDLAYIPSESGYTDVINIETRDRLAQFQTLEGGRVAAISKKNDLLVVLSDHRLAAYSATDGKKRYDLDYGGNAIAFNQEESRFFVGGNMHTSIAEINSYTGKITKIIPIGHSGDLAWANNLLFSANMKTGVMTAYNPFTEKSVTMHTPEADPNFSYNEIPKAKAGFMQLAVSPDQQYVYAAGFSGHILRFSTDKPAYLGEVTVAANKTTANKLSGLAILGNGREAISSVENLHETVIVDLSDGRIIKQIPNVVSNRWVVETS